MNHPAPIENLIKNFSSLPGLGEKTAERLVFNLLKQNNKNTFIEFANNLLAVGKQIHHCQICGNYSEKNICQICQNIKRDKTQICVTAEAQDILYIEKTSAYNGAYHVLNGLLDPMNNITAEKLNIQSLSSRLNDKQIKEIILGLNPTIEGESTIIYLKKIISQKYPNIKITRLSRGLPMGGDLEYADEITLSNALKNRSAV
ncbi:MAG: recombination mediator RecR [Candidatus Kuenenbacteria bacterium]